MDTYMSKASHEAFLKLVASNWDNVASRVVRISQKNKWGLSQLKEAYLRLGGNWNQFERAVIQGAKVHPKQIGAITLAAAVASATPVIAMMAKILKAFAGDDVSDLTGGAQYDIEGKPLGPVNDLMDIASSATSLFKKGSSKNETSSNTNWSSPNSYTDGGSVQPNIQPSNGLNNNTILLIVGVAVFALVAFKR